MDIRRALKAQYGAGLAMLRQAVKRCPDDLWLAGEHPRNTWRVAYHAAYYTHLYLHADSEQFQPWVKHVGKVSDLWGKPKIVPAYSQEDVMGYIDAIVLAMPSLVDAMDLDAQDSGFSYYPGMPKLEHQLVNVRHLQGHVGQLSELLMQRGVYTDWISAS